MIFEDDDSDDESNENHEMECIILGSAEDGYEDEVAVISG